MTVAFLSGLALGGAMVSFAAPVLGYRRRCLITVSFGSCLLGVTTTNQPRPVAGTILLGLSLAVVAFGGLLLLYAALGLPSNEGHSGYSDGLGVIQFVIAGGVPIAGAVAIVRSSQVRGGTSRAGLPLSWLGAAVGLFGLWLLLFLEA